MDAPTAARYRALSAVRSALADDARSAAYRYLWRPLLGLQLVLYTRVVYRFMSEPVYASVPSAEYPLLHENHIGNLVSLASQPNLAVLTVHVAMAWAWIFAVIAQKHFVARMAEGLKGGQEGLFARYRTAHVVVGTGMVALGIVGILAALVITISNHGNPGMQQFLLGQPLFFLPAMAMVWITARRKNLSIRHHLFWADTAFLGPAVASVWTEGAIYVLGRMTSLGPNSAEVWASAVGGGLGALAVVVPGWFARRSGLARDAAASAS